jgi:hypothetical protein
MTDGQDWGQPPQDPPQGYGQQYPLDQPWRPQQYDPRRHQQRIYGQTWQQYPPQQQPNPQQYPQTPPQPPYPPQDDQWGPSSSAYDQRQRDLWQQPYQRQQPLRRRKSWPAQHKVLTGFIAFGALVFIAGIASAAAWPSRPKPAASAAPASASHGAKPTAHARAAPSPACTLTTTFDYIIRVVWPPLQPQADEIGNTDYSDCTSSLADFAATAGQADGECTTIALASDNPGYNVNATPAPPLKDVIKSAGPGC